MDVGETLIAERSLLKIGGDQLLSRKPLQQRGLPILCALILAILVLGLLIGSAAAFEQHGNLTNLGTRLEGGSSNLLWLTFIIAGMDSINPCAFYILTFLLSIPVSYTHLTLPTTERV